MLLYFYMIDFFFNFYVYCFIFYYNMYVIYIISGKNCVVMLKDWGSGHVLYVERVLGAILSDVQHAVDGYTSDAQV